MIPELIDYRGREVLSRGRNGDMRTKSLAIEEYNGFVRLYPLNSKNCLGNGFVGVPKERWLGTALEALMQAKKKELPTWMGIHPLLDEIIESYLKGEEDE